MSVINLRPDNRQGVTTGLIILSKTIPRQNPRTLVNCPFSEKGSACSILSLPAFPYLDPYFSTHYQTALCGRPKISGCLLTSYAANIFTPAPSSLSIPTLTTPESSDPFSLCPFNRTGPGTSVSAGQNTGSLAHIYQNSLLW